MIRLEGRPGDERGFVHKKIIGFIKKPAVKFLAPVVTGLVGGLISKGRGEDAPPPSPTEEKQRGMELKLRAETGLAPQSFAGTGTAIATRDCPRNMRRDFESGRCEPAAGQEMGEAMMGRYGAALVPGILQIDRAVCLRGMQLGNDGLCYNKSQISNKQRLWPRGRRPLLTGGEMRAIGVASRAGTKLDRTTSRLRALGMMKALPKPRKAKAPAHHHHPA